MNATREDVMHYAGLCAGAFTLFAGMCFDAKLLGSAVACCVIAAGAAVTCFLAYLEPVKS